MTNGTPAKVDQHLTNIHPDLSLKLPVSIISIGNQLNYKVSSGILPSHRSFFMRRMILANVGVEESLGTVGSSL
jgi:hypothetical protein